MKKITQEKLLSSERFFGQGILTEDFIDQSIDKVLKKGSYICKNLLTNNLNLIKIRKYETLTIFNRNPIVSSNQTFNIE